MRQPVETRVVQANGVAQSVQVNVRPSWVHWITVNVESQEEVGQIFIYDGFDRRGTLMWQWDAVYGHHHNFIPAFKCDNGIFVYSDAAIASYTLAFKTHHEGDIGYPGG